MDGWRMRELRLAIGLTQAEVAGQLDVDKQTVSRWERGKNRIKRLVEGRFVTLINEDLFCGWIGDHRPKRTRGRPFQKKIC
jgi:transcriptional regulator with XRE-family HTH domain